jgi:imidazoleglycerol-phosphate dehydratase
VVLNKGKAKIIRKTAETSVTMAIKIDGKGENTIATGYPEVNEGLRLFSQHSSINLSLTAKFKLELTAKDEHFHHLLSDIGITLGQCLKTAGKGFKGRSQYGHAFIADGETLIRAVVGVSSIPAYVCKVTDLGEEEKEFFTKLAQHAGLAIHIDGVRIGKNFYTDKGFSKEANKSILNTVMIAFARALRAALSR